MRSAQSTFRLAAMIAATAVSLTSAGTASAQSKWYANLGPEVPGATGSGFAFFSLSGSLLSIEANWSGLSGTTTVAHIHCCTALPNAGTAGVAVTPGTLPGFPMGTQAGAYSITVDLADQASYTASFVNNFGGGTVGGAQAALTTAFGEDAAYFNIHSTTYPGGEIRGFIRVPEPSSLLLTTVAMALLAGGAMRRRAV